MNYLHPPTGPLVSNWDAYAGFGGHRFEQSLPVMTQPFKGLLDEVYVYNCSLSKENIQQVADSCCNSGGMFILRY